MSTVNNFRRLDGQTALITGATNGIGRATAHALAAAGAKLYFICRSQAKGEELIAELRERSGSTHIHMLTADLSLVSEVRRVASEFLQTGDPLHLLVNNAGVTNNSRIVTDEGFEQMFATNHLAYFELTRLLLPRLQENTPARIVSVGSSAHSFVKGGVNWDDLQWQNNFSFMKVYGHSKLCNLLWNRALAARLEGTGVTANCAHPGAVSTGLGAQSAIGKLVQWMMKPFFRSPEKGAETSIYLALAENPTIASGGYYADCKPAKPKPWAEDDAAAEKLWQVTEDLLAKV